MIDPAKLNPVPALFKVLSYLKARLGERTTYAGILTAIAGASQLVSPWSYASIVVGVVMVLIPTKGGDECQP
jgi:hypothetical protein